MRSDSGPSGSDPSALKSTVSGARPLVRSAAACTVGGAFTRWPTTISTVSEAVLPCGSVTVTVAVYVPGSSYVRTGFCRNVAPPSLNSQR